MHQPTGEDEVAKEDGAKEDTKDEWPKDPEIQTMLASIVDKQVIMLGTVHKDKDKTLNQTLLISIMMSNWNFQRTK